EMIVWGGYRGGNSGGRYNPSANTWIGTSTNGAPAARSSHTAVWTGSEMIVWGGDGANLFNTGGRYCSAPLPTTPVLGNISTRLPVETSDNVLIGGFIITGTQPK